MTEYSGTQAPPAWTHAEEAYLSAARLSAWLAGGGSLRPIDSPIVLRADEQVLYSAPCTQFTYARTTVPYSHEFFSVFGTPAWIAASLAGSILYNSYQRTKAEEQAAAQWRLADQGTVHVTSQRVCLQGRLHWVDIWLGDIRALDALPDGVVIHRQDQSPVKIATSSVAYLYVVLSFLTTGRVVDVPLPPEFVARARQAGRSLPGQDADSGSPAGAPPPASGPAPGAVPGAPPPGAGGPYPDAFGNWHAPFQPAPGPKPKVDVLGRPYADWGTRAVARLIDTLVMLAGWAVCAGALIGGVALTAADGTHAASQAAGVVLIVIALLALVIFTVGYHLLHGRESGQSPGKRAVGIQVRDAQTGGRIGYARALGRYLLEVLAWLLLGVVAVVDLLWPLWDDRLQTLHDKAVNSVVVKTTPDLADVVPDQSPTGGGGLR